MTKWPRLSVKPRPLLNSHQWFALRQRYLIRKQNSVQVIENTDTMCQSVEHCLLGAFRGDFISIRAIRPALLSRISYPLALGRNAGHTHGRGQLLHQFVVHLGGLEIEAGQVPKQWKLGFLHLMAHRGNGTLRMSANGASFLSAPACAGSAQYSAASRSRSAPLLGSLSCPATITSSLTISTRPEYSRALTLVDQFTRHRIAVARHRHQIGVRDLGLR